MLHPNNEMTRPIHQRLVHEKLRITPQVMKWRKIEKSKSIFLANSKELKNALPLRMKHQVILHVATREVLKATTHIVVIINPQEELQSQKKKRKNFILYSNYVMT